MPSILVSHPIPKSHGPQIVGAVVMALALPVFLIADWRIASWVLAAALWAAAQTLALVLQRLPLGMGSLASSGAVGFGRMFRAVGVMTVLIVVTVSDASLGLPAAALYGFAYTAELGSSLVMYFGGEAKT
jgi:hypothetical protein